MWRLRLCGLPSLQSRSTHIFLSPSAHLFLQPSLSPSLSTFTCTSTFILTSTSSYTSTFTSPFTSNHMIYLAKSYQLDTQLHDLIRFTWLSLNVHSHDLPTQYFHLQINTTIAFAYKRMPLTYPTTQTDPIKSKQSTYQLISFTYLPSHKLAVYNHILYLLTPMICLQCHGVPHTHSYIHIHIRIHININISVNKIKLSAEAGMVQIPYTDAETYTSSTTSIPKLRP